MKKMIPMLMTLMSLVLVSSCASKPKPRVIKKMYKVVDFSKNIIPAWVDEPIKGDSEQANKTNRYFINESSHKSKRLCMKSAEVRATAKVASEISQFIKNTYGESTNGGDSADEAVTEYMQESLAQQTEAFVVGAQVHKTYWEQRAYDKELGATKNYRKYYCFALIKMNKKALAKAVKNATAKLYTSIKDPEVKQNTKKILKDVAEKFNEVE